MILQAIQWAIAQDADIICMCFSLDKRSMVVGEAVRKAALKDIIMFASTGDKGYNVRESWPARFEEVWGIAACTAEGSKTTYAAHDDVAFAFQGEGISVNLNLEDSVHHNNGHSRSEKVEGSSVATAIASGIASLILATRRLIVAYKGVPAELEKASVGHRRECVRELLNRMMDGNQETKYVKPWTVLETTGTEAEDFIEDLDRKLLNYANVR